MRVSTKPNQLTQNPLASTNIFVTKHHEYQVDFSEHMVDVCIIGLYSIIPQHFIGYILPNIDVENI